jgi:hypothetical protein
MLRPRPDPINRGQYRLWLIPSFISTPTARYREAVLTVEPLTKSVPPAVAGGSLLRPSPHLTKSVSPAAHPLVYLNANRPLPRGGSEPLTKSVPPAVAGGSMLLPRSDPINRGQYRLGLIPSFISTPTARYREAVLT